MKRLVPLLGLLASGGALAAEPTPAKAPPLYFASNCGNCHGTDGKAATAIPPLAGRDKTYLEESMKNFKNGSRPATIMHQLAKGYTDEEIVQLADFFSRQK